MPFHDSSLWGRRRCVGAWPQGAALLATQGVH